MAEHQRLVFISATFLSKEWRNVPSEQLDASIFFFGSKRSWLFPQNDRERKESLRQPTKYLEFEEEFQQLILRKEKQGLVYWLKPDEDYRKVSAFLEQITDPITGSNYKPLILKDTFWKSEWDSKAGKYSKNSDRVICNYRMGEHDYYPVMELLYQSNPTMVPVLRFQKKEQ